MILFVLILVFVIALLSPIGGLLGSAILSNNELVLTFLVIIIFKLLNKKISGLVESTNEKMRENYVNVFLVFLALLLFFAKDHTWWGLETSSFSLTIIAIGIILIPIISLKRAMERKFNEDEEND